MTKYEWEKELRGNLKRLPEAEVARVMDYYNELFEDKIEEGLSEREIVRKFGNPFDVAYKILYDSGAPAGGDEKISPPDPFIPYKKSLQEIGGKIADATQTVVNAVAPQIERAAGIGKSILLHVLFFVPFVICASILWSLVLGIAAGAVGAALGGIVTAISTFWYVGSEVMFAVLGMGIAATGVGVLLSVLAAILIKLSVRLTQKYFFMGKHRMNANQGGKQA